MRTDEERYLVCNHELDYVGRTPGCIKAQEILDFHFHTWNKPELTPSYETLSQEDSYAIFMLQSFMLEICYTICKLIVAENGSDDES